MQTFNLGKFTYIIYVFFFKGDICFTYQFLEDQKLKQERSCQVLKKKICFVRSYPRCPILLRFTVLYLQVPYLFLELYKEIQKIKFKNKTVGRFKIKNLNVVKVRSIFFRSALWRPPVQKGRSSRGS
jgi:hypothetical protein